MRRIAICNQKGGVGKTVCAVNLSAGISLYGRKVLLVDLDPQANTTISFNIEPKTSTFHLFHNSRLEEVTVRTHISNLYLVPSALELAACEVEIVNRKGREEILAERLKEAEEEFDYLIIDSPPSLSLLTINGLMAAREVFVPVQLGYFALEGVNLLFTIIDLVNRELCHKIAVTGAIANFRDRTKMSKEAHIRLKEFFGETLFMTSIRRTVKLDEAISHHKTIFEYAPNSYGADDFRRLTEEVINMENKALQETLFKRTGS